MPDNDNMEPMLRNALDSVNAARRWRLIGITVLFFASAVTLAPQAIGGLSITLVEGSRAAR